MFDQLSASAITGFLPALQYKIPFIGAVDVKLYVVAFLTFIFLTAIFWVLRMIVLVRVKALAQKTSGSFDDVVVDAIE